MAEVMSLVFMVFMVIPVVAPGIGQLVMLFSEWHMIFVFMARDRAGDHRSGRRCACPRPCIRNTAGRSPPRSIVGGFGIVLTNRVALFYTLATTVIFGALFGFINSAQQIYVGIYGLGVWFPVLFAASPA